MQRSQHVMHALMHTLFLECNWHLYSHSGTQSAHPHSHTINYYITYISWLANKAIQIPDTLSSPNLVLFKAKIEIMVYMVISDYPCLISLRELQVEVVPPEAEEWVLSPLEVEEDVWPQEQVILEVSRTSPVYIYIYIKYHLHQHHPLESQQYNKVYERFEDN